MDSDEYRVANCIMDADAEHIASWHPAVALAVADWLDQSDDRDRPALTRAAALAVARAYLGDAP